jgi:hypothetical protein
MKLLIMQVYLYMYMMLTTTALNMLIALRSGFESLKL